MPLAVGIVGGASISHPAARTALKILGVESATELAQVMAAVGLAQNLAALRALVDEGIQKGHMRLHARRLAQEGTLRPTRAKEMLEEQTPKAR